MTLALPVRQPSLWEGGCRDCLAYDACGGSESAPCTCVHTGSRQHDCRRCSIVCTERSVTDGDGRVTDSFRRQLQEGLGLNALRVRQPAFALPPLLLTRTDCLPPDHRLALGWVGVHLRAVLSAVRVTPEPESPATTIRSRLRTNETARLVGILNGHDDLLESLWQLDRRLVLRRLRAARIEVLTGPTYSVYGDNPASHNVTMLLRHHRFCAEACTAGFVVIPNIYWRSRADRMEWATWLGRNPTVHTIARDFSRTKQASPFWMEFDGLLEILEAIPRSMRVLLTGVGMQKMADTGRALERVGASASFVSPQALVAPPVRSRGLDRPAAILERIEEYHLMANAHRALLARPRDQGNRSPRAVGAFASGASFGGSVRSSD